MIGRTLPQSLAALLGELHLVILLLKLELTLFQPFFSEMAIASDF